MRLSSLTVWTPFILCLSAAPAGAQAPADPLRLVPSQAELVVTLTQPRQLLDVVYNHDIVKDVLKIATIRELLDTTNFRRFQQLLAFYEKELGHNAFDLLDKLGGGGAVLAARFSNNPAVVLVIQSRDTELLQRFVTLSLKVAEQEMVRQEIKAKPTQASYRGRPTIQIGPKVNLAIVDGALVFASDMQALRAAVDRGEDSRPDPNLAAVRQTQPKNALAWAWLDMDAVRKIKKFKDGLDSASLDTNVLVLFGGLMDMLRRAPQASAALVQQGKGFGLSVQVPRGREGMKAAELLAPPDDRGSLPLLEPSNALLSVSYFLDLGQLWDNRYKALTKKQAQVLEKADQDTAKFLLGTRVNTLFRQAGPFHRFVMTAPPRPPQQNFPDNPFAAFGYGLAIDMRDAAFARSMETILRGAALFGTFNTPLKMIEEKHGERTIVSYRLLPDQKQSEEVNRLRANFTPSFSHAGNQFIVTSSVELCRELLDLVANEKSSAASPASTRARLSGACAISYLRTLEDQLLTQTILAQALPPNVARQQVQAVVELVERLGLLTLEVRYNSRDSSYELRWQPN